MHLLSYASARVGGTSPAMTHQWHFWCLANQSEEMIVRVSSTTSCGVA